MCRAAGLVGFLFAEEAAELLDGAGGVLLDVTEGVLSTRSGATGAAAAELRFQQASSEAADVGDELGIAGGSLNLKWDGGRTAFALGCAAAHHLAEKRNQ